MLLLLASRLRILKTSPAPASLLELSHALASRLHELDPRHLVSSRWRRPYPGSSPRRHGPPRPQDGRVLVVVQLDGGNDGINTVVPYKDEGYAKSRKALRLPPISCTRSTMRSASTPASPAPPSCSSGASSRSCRGSAIRTRAGRTSGAWRSGRPARRPGRARRARLAGACVRRAARRREDASGTTFVGRGQPPAALIGRRSIPASLERLDDLALKGGPGARGVIGEAPEETTSARSSAGRRSTPTPPPTAWPR